jgi:hypothetical protein
LINIAGNSSTKYLPAEPPAALSRNVPENVVDHREVNDPGDSSGPWTLADVNWVTLYEIRMREVSRTDPTADSHAPGQTELSGCAGTRADDRASDVELFAEWTRKRIGRAAVLDHDEFFQLRQLCLSPARSDPAGERGLLSF